MPASELVVYQRSLQRLNSTRARMEKLFADGRIRKMDIESVYEGLFLRAVTSFETYIERLFMDVLMRRTSHTHDRARVLVEVADEEILQTILLQGRKYNDWLPYDNTIKRAKLYLRDGKPFTLITSVDHNTLKTITFIRNAIAHKSRHALDQFHTNVVAPLPLLRDEKRPAGFLRSQLRASPRQLRFEAFINELGRIATDLN